GKGTRNAASTQRFSIRATPPPQGTPPQPIPSVQLANPLNGTSMSIGTFQTRPYLDVTFGPGVTGATFIGIDGNELQLSGAGAAHLALSSSTPTQLGPTTWRYFLTPAAGFTTANMFVAGQIDVKFLATAPGTSTPTWSVTLPNSGGTLAGAPGVA